MTENRNTATLPPLTKQDYPILEFDASPLAIIEPGHILKPLETMPEWCVLCFFREVIEDICTGEHGEVIQELGSEIGKNQIYALKVGDGQDQKRIAVAHPGVGAPLAAGFLDELIALGCKKFIAVGGAGVLNNTDKLVVGHAIIPDSAIRDEGTSYHYLPPSREVTPHPAGVAAIQKTLKKHDLPYVMGKTWTTDAIYRETPAKVAMRRDEGCLTVEMEAATFFAVAQFRGVQLAQILYAGDDVSGEAWDTRDWHNRASVREKLFWVAVEAVLEM